MFNPTAELVIPRGTQTNDANETQPETVKIKKASFQYNLNNYMSFYTFHL